MEKEKKRKFAKSTQARFREVENDDSAEKKRKYFPFRSRGFFFTLLISRPYLAVNSMRARDEKKKGKYKEKRKTKLALCGSHMYTPVYTEIFGQALYKVSN